jgi:Spy/CpxP family protein refolding chaperone
MRRWWLPLALLLSLGVNVGVVAMLALRGEPRPGAAPRAPLAAEPLALPGPPTGPEGPAGREAPGRRFEELAAQLGLDADARRRFVQLQSRHFEASREARRRLETARRELAKEFLSGRADRARVEELLRAVQTEQASLDRTLGDLLLEAQEILTPEQQRRFAFFVLQRLRAAGAAGPPPPRRGPLRRLMGQR